MPKKIDTNSNPSDGYTKAKAQDVGIVETFESFAAADLWSAYQAYLKGLGVLNDEISSFAKHRLDMDMELSSRMASCKDWTEVIALQQDWGRTTSEDYLTETSKVVDIASAAAKGYWAPFQSASSNSESKVEK